MFYHSVFALHWKKVHFEVVFDFQPSTITFELFALSKIKSYDKEISYENEGVLEWKCDFKMVLIRLCATY